METPEAGKEETGLAPAAPAPPAVPPEAAKVQAPGRRSATIPEYVESILFAILIALFATTFVVQAFKIPSQSMEPTLLVGDHLLVNKFIFGGNGAWYEKLLPYRAIRRGDVIVFKFPFDDHPHYVKRVIGIPGDRIRIVDERVYVNDQPLTEPYVIHDPSAMDPLDENFPPTGLDFSGTSLRPEWAAVIRNYLRDGELVVPRDRYFVMGDNRDRSWDSRYWGFVDRGAIMGRPVVIYWSVDATSQDYDDPGLTGTLHGMLDALLHLPSSTRWRRFLREVH